VSGVLAGAVRGADEGQAPVAGGALTLSPPVVMAPRADGAEIAPAAFVPRRRGRPPGSRGRNSARIILGRGGGGPYQPSRAHHLLGGEGMLLDRPGEPAGGGAGGGGAGRYGGGQQHPAASSSKEQDDGPAPAAGQRRGGAAGDAAGRRTSTHQQQQQHHQQPHQQQQAARHSGSSAGGAAGWGGGDPTPLVSPAGGGPAVLSVRSLAEDGELLQSGALHASALHRADVFFGGGGGAGAAAQRASRRRAADAAPPPVVVPLVGGGSSGGYSGGGFGGGSSSVCRGSGSGGGGGAVPLSPQLQGSGQLLHAHSSFIAAQGPDALPAAGSGGAPEEGQRPPSGPGGLRAVQALRSRRDADAAAAAAAASEGRSGSFDADPVPPPHYASAPTSGGATPLASRVRRPFSGGGGGPATRRGS
jgi:hypothetical protein